ncbi:hypothetical protein ROZALSC1DRAFT_29569, partial [Rozella allomycis CSF55]
FFSVSESPTDKVSDLEMVLNQSTSSDLMRLCDGDLEESVKLAILNRYRPGIDGIMNMPKDEMHLCLVKNALYLKSIGSWDLRRQYVFVDSYLQMMLNENDFIYDKKNQICLSLNEYLRVFCESLVRIEIFRDVVNEYMKNLVKRYRNRVAGQWILFLLMIFKYSIIDCLKVNENFQRLVVEYLSRDSQENEDLVIERMHNVVFLNENVIGNFIWESFKRRNFRPFKRSIENALDLHEKYLEKNSKQKSIISSFLRQIPERMEEFNNESIEQVFKFISKAIKYEDESITSISCRIKIKFTSIKLAIEFYFNLLNYWIERKEKQPNLIKKILSFYEKVFRDLDVSFDIKELMLIKIRSVLNLECGCCYFMTQQQELIHPILFKINEKDLVLEICLNFLQSLILMKKIVDAKNNFSIDNQIEQDLEDDWDDIEIEDENNNFNQEDFNKCYSDCLNISKGEMLSFIESSVSLQSNKAWACLLKLFELFGSEQVIKSFIYYLVYEKYYSETFECKISL